MMNSKTPPHVLYIEDENGRDTEQVCAYIHPASAKSVRTVLDAEENAEDGNGRSEYVWVRLQDGTLILGVFPQGDTYLAVERDAVYPR